jgi:phospholipase C
VNAQRETTGLALTLEARDMAFGAAALGAPFNVYSYGGAFASRAYAVRAGEAIADVIPVDMHYRVRVDGPNGFMRQFARDAGRNDSSAEVSIFVDYDDGKSTSGALRLALMNHGAAEQTVTVNDEAYGAPVRTILLRPGEQRSTRIDTASTRGWYDLSITAGATTNRYAGRLETGKWSISDPAMA